MNITGEENDGTSGAVWIKSSLSAANSNCVEAAQLRGGHVAVRDSKNPHSGILCFTPAEWIAFLGGVRNGEFDTLAGRTDSQT